MLRSGRRAASIGVGTATTKNVAPARSASSAVNLTLVLPSTSGSASPVTSTPCFSCEILRLSMSKPTTCSYFSPKAKVTGNPTYPWPMTAIRSERSKRHPIPVIPLPHGDLPRRGTLQRLAGAAHVVRRGGHGDDGGVGNAQVLALRRLESR